MFCENCGTKLEKDVQFCQNCGRKIGEVSTVLKTPQSAPVGAAEFYGEDWRRKKIFAIASIPYFDVMVDKNSLYIIQMPKYSGATWGFILGLILLSIIGAFIGSSIGGSNDRKKRKWYRAAWINENHQLISNDYSHDIFLKIPLESLRGNLVFGKNKFTLTSGEKTIVLQKSQKEFELFKQSIEKYVL